jgi:hypothetical protein
VTQELPAASRCGWSKMRFTATTTPRITALAIPRSCSGTSGLLQSRQIKASAYKFVQVLPVQIRRRFYHYQMYDTRGFDLFFGTPFTSAKHLKQSLK